MEIDCRKICKKLPKEICDKNERCIYTNGVKRRFCRLKYNKMNENCDRRITEKRKNPTIKKKTIIRITKKQKERGLIIKATMEREEAEEKKTKARAIIGRFMNKTKHRRKSMFLKALCLDSGVCLAFGTYTNEIKKHFDGFVNFKYAIAPIKRIGAPSANGFINEIQYDNNGYKAYAVLKSSVNETSDNLMYEYMVGQYVNKLNKRFPCFLETYGYYTYKDANTWNFLRNTIQTTDMRTIKQGLVLQKTIDYANACNNSKLLSILIQHLKGIKSFKSMMSIDTFVRNEMLNILFQIYIPLSLLSTTFTHYDLHNENVNVYEPEQNSYIQFHYHFTPNNVVSFKSKYIAKIIDYGRSYYNDEEANMDSKKVHKELCKEHDCFPDCGYNQGFNWLSSHTDMKRYYWINSQESNESHDLRLLNMIEKEAKKKNTYNSLGVDMQTMLKMLKYDDVYGTKERMRIGFPNRIYNMLDAAFSLTKFIQSPQQVELNENEYRGKIKLGDLHIYCADDDKRPMRFQKA
jgi:hypothetical protein